MNIKGHIFKTIDAMFQINQIGKFNIDNLEVDFDFWIDDDIEYLTLDIKIDNKTRFYMFGETLRVRQAFMRDARLDI